MYDFNRISKTKNEKIRHNFSPTTNQVTDAAKKNNNTSPNNKDNRNESSNKTDRDHYIKKAIM